MKLSEQVAILEQEVDLLTEQVGNQSLLLQIADVIGNSKAKWRGHYETLPNDLQELIRLHDRYQSGT